MARYDEETSEEDGEGGERTEEDDAEEEEEKEEEEEEEEDGHDAGEEPAAEAAKTDGEKDPGAAGGRQPSDAAGGGGGEDEEDDDEEEDDKEEDEDDGAARPPVDGLWAARRHRRAARCEHRSVSVCPILCAAVRCSACCAALSSLFLPPLRSMGSLPRASSIIKHSSCGRLLEFHRTHRSTASLLSLKHCPFATAGRRGSAGRWRCSSPRRPL